MRVRPLMAEKMQMRNFDPFFAFFAPNLGPAACLSIQWRDYKFMEQYNMTIGGSGFQAVCFLWDWSCWPTFFLSRSGKECSVLWMVLLSNLWAFFYGCDHSFAVLTTGSWPTKGSIATFAPLFSKKFLCWRNLTSSVVTKKKVVAVDSVEDESGKIMVVTKESTHRIRNPPLLSADNDFWAVKARWALTLER